MELNERLQEIENKLGEVLAEFIEVKALLEAQSEPKEEAEQEADKPVMGAGYENLARLYENGYHICHPKFGAKRTLKEGECLFCTNLLQK